MFSIYLSAEKITISLSCFLFFTGKYALLNWATVRFNNGTFEKKIKKLWSMLYTTVWMLRLYTIKHHSYLD